MVEVSSWVSWVYWLCESVESKGRNVEFYFFMSKDSAVSLSHALRGVWPAQSGDAGMQDLPNRRSPGFCHLQHQIDTFAQTAAYIFLNAVCSV